MKLAATGVLVGLLTSGCADNHYSDSDLEAFVDETARKFPSTPISRTDPTPAISSAEPVAYAAGELRSPFQPPSTLKPIAAGEPMVTPDLEREKAHLEGFPMEQLRLVGNLSGQAMQVVLVQDPEGLVHPVGVGDHIGTDFGRILAVDDGGIELLEIVRHADRWVKRPRFIPLTGDPEDK